MRIQEKIGNRLKKILIITTLVVVFGLIQKTDSQYYYYDSGTTTYPYQQGCNEDLYIRIDSQGKSIRGGRFHLILDPTKFNYSTSSNVDILRTNLFNASSDTFIGRSDIGSPSWLTGGTSILQIDRTNITNDYNGTTGLYGIIKFVPLYNVFGFFGSFGMEYISGSSTMETTLIRTGSIELINPTQQALYLTGTYSILQQPCTEDSNEPIIFISTPTNGGDKQNKSSGIFLSLNEATGVNGLSNVPYIWTGLMRTGNPGGIVSNQYGININSFNLVISGNSQTKTFTGSSLGVISTGNNKTRQDNDKNYILTINQAQIFDYGVEKTITITTNVSDRKGNAAIQKTITFNNPIGPQLLGTPSPDSNDIFVDISAPINISIQDNRAGINSGSIKVTLLGTNGTNYGPYIFSGNSLNLSGISSTANQPNYSISINHPDFPTSGTIRISIYAEDMENNIDTIQDYNFSTRPSCNELQCCYITITTKNQQIPYNQNTIYISGRNYPTFYTGIDGSGYIDCNTQNVGLKIYNGEENNSGSATTLSSYYDIQSIILSGRSGIKAILSGNTIYLSIIGLFGYDLTGAILFTGQELETGTLVGPEDVDITINNSFNSGIVMQSTGNILAPEVIEAYIPVDTTIIQTGYECAPNILQHPILTGKNYAESGLSDQNIYTTFKIGFICSGSTAKFYDMSGNAKEIEIRVKDPNLISNGITKVRYSNDLINRNSMGTANVVNYIATFTTTHFTYFALGDDKPIREQPEQIGGGGGGIKIIKDNCPEGDYSDSYYDKDCGDSQGHEIVNYCGVGETKYTYEQVDAFQYAYGLGITTMCPIQDARLDGYIRRKELAKMISEFAIKVIGLYPDFSKTQCDTYTDISKESKELQFYIKLSCRLGLMGLNTDGTTVKNDFNPNYYVDRAQFGTIMSRLIFGSKYNGNKDNRYIDHLNGLKKYQIMKYISEPAMKELRGYIMIMMQRTEESGIIKHMRAATDLINGANNLWIDNLYNPSPQ